MMESDNVAPLKENISTHTKSIPLSGEKVVA